MNHSETDDCGTGGGTVGPVGCCQDPQAHGRTQWHPQRYSTSSLAKSGEGLKVGIDGYLSPSL